MCERDSEYKPTGRKNHQLFSLLSRTLSFQKKTHRVRGSVRKAAKQARGHAADLLVVEGLRVLEGGLDATLVLGEAAGVARAEHGAEGIVADDDRGRRDLLGGGQGEAGLGLGGVRGPLEVCVELELRQGGADVGGGGSGLFFFSFWFRNEIQNQAFFSIKVGATVRALSRRTRNHSRNSPSAAPSTPRQARGRRR